MTRDARETARIRWPQNAPAKAIALVRPGWWLAGCRQELHK